MIIVILSAVIVAGISLFYQSSNSASVGKAYYDPAYVLEPEHQGTSLFNLAIMSVVVVVTSATLFFILIKKKLKN